MAEKIEAVDGPEHSASVMSRDAEIQKIGEDYYWNRITSSEMRNLFEKRFPEASDKVIDRLWHITMIALR